MENMTEFEIAFLVITFLFMVGSMYGWVIELLFRRFISKKNPLRKWINPGFLVGPCLPLYGFGLVFLFIISFLPYVGLEQNAENRVVQVITTILTMGVVMTVIEYIAGLIVSIAILLMGYSLFRNALERILQLDQRKRPV